MSMLAEPRRKQKWSVDPRNSAWSNDDSKFGQKMLERMGWSKGKGLGRSEQGTTDHVKVKVKNDSYGLGANVSYEDKWIAHQDDFNELLAQLNHHHGQNTSTEPPTQEKKGFSLEEKSKMSRKRVHYMKFTKGKDLSSRTETDLNCIFGKRARHAKDQEQESNSCESRSSETDETSTPELDTESITKTVTSTLTMQEYFAQRMSQLKRARGQAQSAAPIAEVEGNETSHPSEEPSPIHSSSNDDAEEPKKKRKKKKKNKKATEELEVTKENTSAPNVIEEDGDGQQEHLGKKKRKRKMAENEGATDENCSSTSGVEQNCEELPPSKKKKKKKKTTTERKKHEETEPLNAHRPIEDPVVDSEVVHKKEKSREEVDNVVKEDKVELIEKKCKKDKKKKKKTSKRGLN